MLVTGIQMLFAYPENHVEIGLVILFLPSQKFHAQQIVVLSSSMRLGPVFWSYSLQLRLDYIYLSQLKQSEVHFQITQQYYNNYHVLLVIH